MKTTPKRSKVQPLPDDGLHEYMCIAPNFWGRSDTAAVAITNCRVAGASDEAMKLKRIVIVPKGAKLDEVNGQWITWPGNSGHQDKACDNCTFQHKQ